MTKTERDRDLVRRCIVEKWALLVAEPTMNDPACALCAEYYDKGGGPNCDGCPIYKKTKRRKCRGTPYDAWTSDCTTETARAEYDFLWALYDELTEKIILEPERRIGCRPCTQCGKFTIALEDTDAVCNICREAKALAEKLNYKSITIPAHADEDGELDFWINYGDVVKAIRDEYDVTIHPSQITSEEGFGELGVFDVKIKLGEGAEATVKMWVVRETPDEEDKSGTCMLCGGVSITVAKTDHGWMCGRCRDTCFDADGRYLVPVTRGGPWHDAAGDEWEHWFGTRYVGWTGEYRVKGGRVQCRGDSGASWTTLRKDGAAKPGARLYAPSGYTGPLPAGCRWAEGSEPKPYKVLEVSADGEHWEEIVRSQDVNTIMMPGASAYRYTRTRIVGVGGKTKDTHMTDLSAPKTKADAITTRAAVTSLGRIVSDIALTLKRDEFRSTKAEEAFGAYERQAERLLERLAGGAPDASRLLGNLGSAVANACRDLADAFPGEPAHSTFRLLSINARGIADEAGGGK